MRYAVTPAWVFVMLIVMGIGFIGGAGAFILFVPQPTGTIVGVTWVLMGGGFVFFSVRTLRGRKDDERIRREGTPATATLLAATMTGIVINNVPLWKLRLRIDGAGASYETTMKLCTFSPPGNGATLSVRVDPARREHVVLADDDATAQPAAGGPTPDVFAALGGTGSSAEVAMLRSFLQQAAANGSTTTVVNPDGSTTITTSSTTVQSGEPSDAAQEVKLLADLDRMHAGGAIGDDDFEALKRKLLDGK